MAHWQGTPSQENKSGSLIFSKIAITQAFCPPPSMDEKIAQDLGYIRSYLMEDERLYLSLMADGGIYTLEKMVTDSASVIYISPEMGGPRNWIVPDKFEEVPLRSEPSTEAEVISRYASGTLLDNLDCQKRESEIWCDVQQLGGGPRGFVRATYLQPAIAPDGAVAKGPDNSALRLGQGDFDATGKVPCAQYEGQPMQSCDYKVARAGGGYAAVEITKPDGTPRVIYFRMGIPIGASTSEADPGGTFNVQKEADLHFIRLGTERYEIPDAVVLGG
jgi:hypothetical protein